MANQLWGADLAGIESVYKSHYYGSNTDVSINGVTFKDYQRIAQAYGEATYTCSTRRALRALRKGLPKTRLHAYVYGHTRRKMDAKICDFSYLFIKGERSRKHCIYMLKHGSGHAKSMLEKVMQK